MHSYHAVNPVGSIDLTNVEDAEIMDIEVSLWVPEFMNTPTPSATISVMAPGETRAVEFPASFNNTIFNFTGSRPINGELVVSYLLDDRAAAIDSEAVADYTNFAAVAGASGEGRAAEFEEWGILFVEGE